MYQTPQTTVTRTASFIISTIVVTACGIPPRDRPNWTEQPGALFDIGPYLLLAGKGQAIVAMSGGKHSPVVRWWPSSSREPTQPKDVQAVTANKSGDLWIARLSNLPDDRYVAYQVESMGRRTPIKTFRIGRLPGQQFRFAAFGDTRTGHAVHRAVVEAVAREHVDFVAHTGDMVERGGKDPQWRRFFQIERTLLDHAPILPALGNHDKSTRGYFRQYFLHRLWAKNRRYFAHDWGNLRIVSVDAEIECRSGCTQYAFVERVLAQAAERGMLIVMMLHMPPYSSGQHGSNLTVQRPITRLARQYGVELVISGHDHNYERTKPMAGTTYIVSGSAGAPIRPVGISPFTAVARTEPHYVLIDVSQTGLAIRAVNLRGDTFDTAWIPPNPPSP